MWRMRVVCWLSKATRAQEHDRVCAPTPTNTYANTNRYACTPSLQQARTHTGIRNTHFFSTATVVSKTRLNISLYVYCFSCSIIRLHTYDQPVHYREQHFSSF